MSEMFLRVKIRNIPGGQKGFGLVVALFSLVILAMFGVLIARYISTTTVASIDDYRWAQALYSAESTAHSIILYRDGGGVGGVPNPSTINNVTNTGVDGWGGKGIPSTLTVQGQITGTDILRTIEVKYIIN